MAEMRLAGLLDAGGLIGSASQTGTPRCVPEGRTHAYVIHDATADGANGTQVAVDVYNVGTTFSMGLKREF